MTPDFSSIGGSDHDALIIGAGPAGALAARQLAASGTRVLLVEREAFPRYKVCGACLNGNALATLEAVGLGALAPRLGAIGLNTFALHMSGRSARLPLPVGAALSRARLDAALVDAACDAGAAFLPETQGIVASVKGNRRLVRLVQRGSTSSVSARVVLVAAGIGRHGLAQEPGLIAEPSADSRIGAGSSVEVFPDAYREGTIFMAVGRRGYLGLVRVEMGQLNLAAALDGAFLRDAGGLGSAAASLLAEAGLPAIPSLRDAHWRGTVRLTRRPRQVAADRLFLIGDAAGYVEPFTGEGMGWALTSAVAVAPLALQAIDSWRPSLATSWSSLHGSLVGRRQYLCRGLARLLRHPGLSRLALEVAAHAPRLVRSTMERLNAPPILPQVG
jgi:flavin-dependent dehydrogenase